MAMRVLVVEDDLLLADGLCTGLRQHGYTVDHLSDGKTAEQAILTDDFDVVLLDIGLPGQSGLALLKAVRHAKVSTPIILLTARDTLEDKVLGLDYGADDYIVKPFDLDELCARVRARVRGGQGRSEPLLKQGRVVLNPAAYQVLIDDQVVGFSRREFALLHALMAQADRVVTREALVQSLYGWDEEVESNTVDVHLHNIRKKLDGALTIRTVRGLGYSLLSSS